MNDLTALRLRTMRHALVYWLDVAYMRRVGRPRDIRAAYREVSIRACRDLAWAGYNPPEITRLWRSALTGELATLPEPTGNVFTRRRAMAVEQAVLPLEVPA